MKTGDEQLARAEELYLEAFNVQRDPRSLEYRRGALEALIYRCTGIGIAGNCPYRIGTVEFDAFGAGLDDGHRIWRVHVGRNRQKGRWWPAATGSANNS
jgi:hypothetical protein